jgi:hypothetical protein
MDVQLSNSKVSGISRRRHRSGCPTPARLRGQAEQHPPACPLLLQVSLQMGEAAFSGKYEPSRDGLDCVAIFDGSSFRLELLGAAVKSLRHLGGSGRASFAAAPAGSARPEPVAAAAAQCEAPSSRAGAAGAGPSLAEVAAQLDVAGALDAPGAAEGAAGPATDGGTTKQLEEELMAALIEDGGWGAGAEGGAGAADEEAAVEEEEAAVEEEEAAVEEEEEAAVEEEEEAAVEEEEEAAVEEEEGDEREPDSTDGAGAAAPQQQGAAPPGQAPLAAPAPILVAPTLQHDQLTEDERLFFYGFDGSPEPHAQSSGSGDDGDGSDGGGGESDVPREEI